MSSEVQFNSYNIFEHWPRWVEEHGAGGKAWNEGGKSSLSRHWKNVLTGFGGYSELPKQLVAGTVTPYNSPSQHRVRGRPTPAYNKFEEHCS